MVKKCFSTGRYVILDSGFCVLKGISELKKEGIADGASIKKQHYWRSLAWECKEVGDTDVLNGSLSNVKYFIWGMKEPDYMMKIMGTDNTLITDGCKETQRKWTKGNESHSKKSRTQRPFHWHFY